MLAFASSTLPQSGGVERGVRPPLTQLNDRPFERPQSGLSTAGTSMPRIFRIDSRFDNGDCERKEQRKARQSIADSVRDALEKKRSLGLLMGRLSFLDTVFLASLLRVPRVQELAKLNPVGYRLLTPTVAFDEYVLRHLFDRSLICVHPETHPESIRIEAGVISEIAWHGVHWTLPLPMEGPTPSQFRQMLEETLFSAAWLEESGIDEVLGLTRPSTSILLFRPAYKPIV
jgi:hypothetical protein